MATRIKIEKSLYEQLKSAAEKKGYASTEELITHVLEREVAGADDQVADAEVEKQLRGLGYIE